MKNWLVEQENKALATGNELYVEIGDEDEEHHQFIGK